MIKNSQWRIPVILFFVTLVTTTVTGMNYAGVNLNQWYQGLFFSIPLLLILLTHEMGHYIAARKHNIDVSPPYFIPLPPPFGLGTLGAVIKIREPISKPSALIDVGAAGPLSGLIVAVIVLIIGISMSDVSSIPLEREHQLMTEGNSILYISLKFFIKGEYLPSGNRDLMMHPVAFAGWIGLLITMINLIPIGQLDGGHIAHGWFGNKYNKFSTLLHKFLPVFGTVIASFIAFDTYVRMKFRVLLLSGNINGGISFADAFFSGLNAAAPWFVWPLVIYILSKLSGGISHPPVNNEPLKHRNKVTVTVILVIFIIIFMPVPMRMT